MAKAETQYERFARAQKFHGVASLWFADDHVLLVDKALVTETYKRYYYGDNFVHPDSPEHSEWKKSRAQSKSTIR